MGQSGDWTETTLTRYRTIVADPPWPLDWTMGKTRVNGRGERHTIRKRKIGYERMAIEDICAVPVAELAEDDANLFLWTTDQFLIDGSARRVAESWGFRPARLLIWAKRNFGLGNFPRPQHEPLLVCRRGRLDFNVRNVGSVQTWDHPRRYDGSKIHSAKPDAALDLIEQASPGPYAELFARRARFGSDYPIGDQALGGEAA